jgi:putative Mg2+ transporter-C (MgtC) family protein
VRQYLVQAAVSPAANTLHGQGWDQIGELGVALLLSVAIGLEREVRQKDAGLRTHTLVGVGSALFMLISKYGFTDVLEGRLVVLDPSRMAAQIVSGIGFIGAGLIFVRRDSVRGLTTAAGIWVCAAVGAAAGAGLLLLASLTTGAYLVITLIVPLARRHLPLASSGISTLRVRYPDGRGILRRLLNEATQRGFAIDDLQVEPDRSSAEHNGKPAMVAVMMHVHGKRPVSELAEALTDLDLVDAVVVTNFDGADEWLHGLGRRASRRRSGASPGRTMRVWEQLAG